MSSLIGGQLINGGWINQSDISNTIDGTASGAFAANSYQRGIPIRQCQLMQMYKEQPLNISGLLGAPTSRRVSFGARFAFTIWFDTNNAIEPNSAQLPSFRQRDPFQLVFLLGYNPTVSTGSYYAAYYAPRCVADSITPVWDEESNPRKLIGEEVVGHTKGWTFLLPTDGNPSDQTTLVGAYLYYLTHAGASLI